MPALVVMAYTNHARFTSPEPLTFVVVGDQDGIAPPATMERRVAALRAQGTRVEFHRYESVGHGFGLGTATSADGWVAEVVRFRSEVIQRRRCASSTHPRLQGRRVAVTLNLHIPMGRSRRRSAPTNADRTRLQLDVALHHRARKQGLSRQRPSADDSSGETGSRGRARRQNLPFAFFHSVRGGMGSIVSQCSTSLPPCTRKRS